MLTLTLTRTETSDEGTFGLLEGEALRMQTGELPWRNNIRSHSCVPVGTYRCQPHVSPRLGKCFWVKDVPGRSEILIHVANYMGDVDKGWRSQLEGCIAIGFGHSENSSGQDMVTDSRHALEKLMEYTGWTPFMLEIVNATDVDMELT